MGMFLSLNSDHLILAFVLSKADFFRKLLLRAASVTHSFRNQSQGTSYELDQKIDRSRDSMTATNTSTQDIFELEARLGFWGTIYEDL